jgi:hypothetical protein
MNIKIEVVKHMAEQLKQLFPEEKYFVLSVWPDSPAELQLMGGAASGIEQYAKAIEQLRQLGLTDPEKELFWPDEKYGTLPFTKLSGVVDGLRVSAFPSEHPPTSP